LIATAARGAAGKRGLKHAAELTSRRGLRSRVTGTFATYAARLSNHTISHEQDFDRSSVDSTLTRCTAQGGWLGKCDDTL